MLPLTLTEDIDQIIVHCLGDVHAKPPTTCPIETILHYLYLIGMHEYFTIALGTCVPFRHDVLSSDCNQFRCIQCALLLLPKRGLPIQRMGR